MSAIARLEVSTSRPPASSAGTGGGVDLSETSEPYSLPQQMVDLTATASGV